jgi:hypothetical protein
MNYNWRPIEDRTSGVIFMQGKYLPCPDIGGIKCSIDPKEYDLIFASESPPEEFKKFDCLPNNGMAPLVNKKVLDIFNKLCPNDIQAFPATIVPEPGSPYKFENHDYWVINITKLVDVIDLEKSIISFYVEKPDRIDNIKKLVFLDKEEFKKPFISRIINDHSLKIVSPALVQSLKEANVTGVHFIEDKEYF